MGAGPFEVVEVRAAQRVADQLTPTQARAVRDARYSQLLGAFLVGLDVRMDVRIRLIEAGLLSRRPGGGLSKMGRDVRDVLIARRRRVLVDEKPSRQRRRRS